MIISIDKDILCILYLSQTITALYKLQHLFYADDLPIYLRVGINQLKLGVVALSRVVNRVFEWAGNADLKVVR